MKVFIDYYIYLYILYIYIYYTYRKFVKKIYKMFDRLILQVLFGGITIGENNEEVAKRICTRNGITTNKVTRSRNNN